MKVVLREGAELGSGGFGTVYRATELDTEGLVALKKSRVSLRIKRPTLEHEVRVLKLLSGHPAIPHVYGYGRIKHFELLSMELLDESLGSIVKTKGPLPLGTVIDVAGQLMDALEHIHAHGLVHRDIKPDNIMFRTPGSRRVCLIDFGLTYPAPGATQVAEGPPHNPSEPTTVFGTLSYASLNAHRRLRLTYRDDLESVGYTLIYLLRGTLPWSHYTRHGTAYGRIRQVYAQKSRLKGSDLATDLPDEFGTLVDYARSLSADKSPDYREWQGRWSRRAAQFPNEDMSYIHTQPLACPEEPRAPPPVEPGQLALVKLDSSVTAEGYSIQAGHEDSYVDDPCFDTPEWNSPLRPYVILKVEWDDRAKLFSFTAAPISNNTNLESCNPLHVAIFNSGSSLLRSQQPSDSSGSNWPFDRSYCYAFKRLTKFYCLPSQKILKSVWSIHPPNIGTIITDLTPPRNLKQFTSLHSTRQLDPDVRDDANMRTSYAKLYAQISSLTPTEIIQESIDWNTTRGWFDECVRATKYYDMCNGDQWARSSSSENSEGSEEDESDSYRGEDFEQWENRQRERDRSITVAGIVDINGSQPLDLTEGVSRIELVE